MKTQEDQTMPGFGRSEARTTMEREETKREGTSYLPTETSAQIHERWLQIQSEFVDDPRKSVSDAQQLVAELMQRIVDSFAEQRDQLERQWAGGGAASTEELRVAVQRYRDLFSRLVPTATGETRTH